MASGGGGAGQGGTSGPKTGGGFTVVGGCTDTEWLKAAPAYCDAD